LIGPLVDWSVKNTSSKVKADVGVKLKSAFGPAKTSMFLVKVPTQLESETTVT